MTKTLNVGAVVWVAEFGFADKPGAKRAPGIVLTSHRYHEARPDVIVARVTTKMHHASGFGAILIQNWSESGLNEPSVIKPVLMTVGKDQIVRVAGQLDCQTLTDLKKAFKAIFPLAA